MCSPHSSRYFVSNSYFCIFFQMEVFGGTIDNQLTGLSLSERHRSLNQLISKSDPLLLSPENLQNWTNKSQADQIYIAKLADHSKNARVLCDIFKSENEMVVAIALNATWLFKGQTDVDLINADYFINEIFPYASYHTICRIVSLFGAHLENENLAQDLFEKIVPLYEINLAIKLLPDCSNEFIRSQIMVDNFIVPSQQLVYIYKKDPELVIEYLVKYLRKDDVGKLPMTIRYHQDYDKLFSLIAQQFPKKFLEIYGEYVNYIHIKLGARTTLGILKVGRDTVCQSPATYMKILHLPTLKSHLKGEAFELFVLELMPAREKDFGYGHISDILNTYKPLYRINFLLKIYALKYNGSSFLHRDDFTNWEMVKYLPVDVRNTWAVAKIANLKSTDWLKEEHFLKFLSTDKAIPRLMTLSKAASEMEYRITLLERMIDCCQINDDKECLLKVLTYTAQRHRNDQEILRYRFLDNLQSSFELYKLPAEHWAVINEMIEFMCVSKEIENHGRQHFLSRFLEQSLRYNLDKGQPIDAIVDKFIKYNINNINLLVGVPKHEFIVLDAFFEKYRVSIESSMKYDKVEGMLEQLILSYRKRSDSGKHSVTECPWLVDVLKKLMEKTDLRDMRSILYYLQEDVKARIMFADKLFQYDSSQKYCTNYLRHDAGVVTRNLSFLFDRCLQTYTLTNYAKIFRQIRAYMNKPLVELFVNAVKERCTTPEKEAIMTVALCLLLNPEESEDLLKKHIPTQTKIDLAVQTQEYLNGEIIANKFMIINPPVSYDMLLNFAKDDFLKFTVPAVLSLPFKKSSADTLDFMKVLMTKPVSVKKHGIRLAYFLYPRKDLLHFYRGLWDAEKNNSIREVLFQRTFRLLQKESDITRNREIWEMLKHFMTSFTELDKPLFLYLREFEKIMPELLSDFCQTCWTTLKRLRSNKCQVDSEIQYLSSGFVRCVDYLSPDFCESLIEEYIYFIGEQLIESENLLNFLVHYIVHAKNPEVQETHLKSTCDLFKKFIAEKWNKKVDGLFAYRNTLKIFALGCSRAALNSKLQVDPNNLLKSILELLSSSLPLGAFVDLYLILNLSLIYRQVLSERTDVESPASRLLLMKALGKKVGIYLIESCEKFGIEFYPMFFIPFQTFLGSIPNPYEEMEEVLMYFIAGLIGNKTSLSYIMAIDLLPSRFDTDEKNYSIQKNILNEIKTNGNFTVKVHLDSKFAFDSIELFGNI